MIWRNLRVVWVGAVVAALVALVGCASSSGGVAPAAPPVPAQSGGAGAATSAVPAQTDTRMVARDAQIALQIADVGAGLQQIHDLAGTYGGYVRSTMVVNSADDDGGQPIAEVTIVVRADAYDQAMAALRRLAVKVESENSSTRDVTDQYVDVSANLRNLQASEDALVKLMDRASSVNDVLAIQQKLTDVRGQIQRIDAQKRLLEQQIALSTIKVSLRPVPTPLAGVPAWFPLQTVARGWNAGLLTLRALADGLLLAVSFGWWLIGIAAVGMVLRRRIIRGPRPAPAPPAAGGP